MSVINDPLAVEWLSLLEKTPCFASLHFEIPKPDDPSASEVTGGSYARSPLTWQVASGQTRFLWNIQSLQWLNLQQVTLVAVGAWTDPTKGQLLLWAMLEPPVPVNDRGSFQIAANQLFVTV